MRKFVEKYINKAKDIANALNPQNMKAKSAGGFCDGKTEIGNQDLYAQAFNPLLNILSDWDNGSLIINGNNISYFKDYTDSHERMIAYYFYKIDPEVDVTQYYFKKLVDLEAVNSYPQLPVPLGINEYSGWLDEINANRNGTTRPACIEMETFGASATDIIISNSYDFATIQQQSYAQNLASYNKPGFKNIYFSKGFAMSNDLARLSQASHPNLNLYDGITINPSTGEPYPRAGFQSWITSGSSYPDIHGNTQTTTPYPPNSYKDFLFRIKSTAENPTVQSNGQIKYPFTITFDYSSVTHRIRMDRYKTMFYGINVDMSPQEVYNHFNTMVEMFGAGGGFPTNGFFPITNASLNDPNLHVAFSGPVPSNTQSMNNVVVGAPFVANDFAGGAYSYTHNYPSNTLPSGAGMSIYDKVRYLGRPNMHGGGIDNCEGCESGCWWDRKQEKIKCHSVQNSAFPFKSNVDCNIFRQAYPGYLCKSQSTPVIIDIDRDRDQVLSTSEPATTITTTYFTCEHPCLQSLLVASPTYSAINALTFPYSVFGIKSFIFDYATQSFGLEGCALGDGVAVLTLHEAPFSGTYTWTTVQDTSTAPPYALGTNIPTVGTLWLHPGRYSAEFTSTDYVNTSYWDICLDWDGSTGNLKQVPCINGKTPCCPTGVNCAPHVPLLPAYPCQHDCLKKPVTMGSTTLNSPQTIPPTHFLKCGVRNFVFNANPSFNPNLANPSTLYASICSDYGHQTEMLFNGNIIYQTPVNPLPPPQPQNWSNLSSLPLVSALLHGAGRYTVKTLCSETSGTGTTPALNMVTAAMLPASAFSYWDICLDYDVNGDLEEVPCTNRKTPCCPTGINCNQITPVLQTADSINTFESDTKFPTTLNEPRNSY